MEQKRNKVENKLATNDKPKMIKFLFKIQRLIFCLFEEIDKDLYETLMPYYYPLDEQDSNRKLIKEGERVEFEKEKDLKENFLNSTTECLRMEKSQIDKNNMLVHIKYGFISGFLFFEKSYCFVVYCIVV